VAQRFQPGILLVASLALATLHGCRSAPPFVDQGQLLVRSGEAGARTSPAVLYLEPQSGAGPIPWRAAQVDVASDGALFRPPLTAVYTGDSVRFVNRGPLAHRIFTADPESRRERLVAPFGESKALRVTKPGENRFYCSLHPDESLVIFAAPSPFFVVTRGAPAHQLERIPTGRYRLNAWSEAGLRFLGPIEIRSGQTTSHTLSDEPR